MPFFLRFSSCCRSTAAVTPRLYQDTVENTQPPPPDNPITYGGRGKEQSVGRMRCSKLESAAHWQPALSAILEDNNGGAHFSVKKTGDRKRPAGEPGSSPSLIVITVEMITGRTQWRRW